MSDQIRLDNLSVSLKGKQLYKELNISIEEGEHFVFLGPNGIGKTLLLEFMCMGNCNDFAARYKGVSVTGRILDKNGENLLDPGVKRKIAYVSQNEDFYKNMTVKEICATSCSGIGLELDEEKMDYYLKRFDLLEKKNQKIKNNVSFGEGKIVHIVSRMLKLGAAELFVLDEPLNHLSFKNSKVFNELILDEIASNPKLTIIVVSHCRAMSFAEKALVYTTENNGLSIKPYHSYDCFSNNDYASCF